MIKNKDKRLARILAVQYLFSEKISAENELGSIAFEPETLMSIQEEKKFDSKLYEKLLSNIDSYMKEIDSAIKAKASERPLNEIKDIVLIILRLGIFEAFIARLNPPQIVINEFVEVTKDLCAGDNSSNLVNGIFGGILRDEDLVKKLSELYVENEFGA